MTAIYFLIACILYYVWKGYNDSGNNMAPVSRIRKPVKFISNNKPIPEHTNLTIHYSRLLRVPVSLPSFSAEVIDVCYKYAAPSNFENCYEDLFAAKSYLIDRINYTTYLN